MGKNGIGESWFNSKKRSANKELGLWKKKRIMIKININKEKDKGRKTDR